MSHQDASNAQRGQRHHHTQDNQISEYNYRMFHKKTTPLTFYYTFAKSWPIF